MREPLAVRMAPRNLDEVVGQSHILGPGRLLRRIIETNQPGSFIFWGQSGTGKTVVGRLIGLRSHVHVDNINAALSGVQELKQIATEARQRRSLVQKRTVLIIDELHHFNRTQQDMLLPDVESGNLYVIGITTENPYYYVNRAIISRSMVFEFKPLCKEDLKIIADRALKDKEHGFGGSPVKITEDALDFLAGASEGDARRLLNALELAVETSIKGDKSEVLIDMGLAEDCIQRKAVRYDKKQDGHYDTISAFIKSMRASDPDATLYWLAKMLYAGEDPRFIARRIVICASEDVGMADPDALVIASSATRAVEFVGMPEARIPLAQAALYVSCAPKSKSVYNAISRALDDVEQKQISEVPEPYTSRGSAGYADPHKQPYLATDMFPPEKRFYLPGFAGRENRFRINLEKMRLRRDVLCLRRQLSVSERKMKSARIAEKVLQQDEVKQARTILLYASFESEVETSGLIKTLKSQQKRVVLPVVQSSGLKLVELTKQPEEMKPGKWGIPEPEVSQDVIVSMAEINLVIVPGVAFDKELHRLGRGKGFYDMLLADISADIRKFAIAFECQIVKEIPTAYNDMPVDKLITESRVLNNVVKESEE